MGTHRFRGLGAAGVQAVGWARQREVAGFCTGPATVLGPGGTLLPAGGAAAGAATMGLGDAKGQDPGQMVGGRRGGHGTEGWMRWLNGKGASG